MLQRIAIALWLCAYCTGAAADTVVLANGDTLTGEIIEWDFDSLVIEHPQLGRIRLSLEQLALDTGEPPSKGLFGSNILRGWKRRLDIGVNGQDGNTINLNVTAGLTMSYEDDFKRWHFGARYFLDSEDNELTDNNARLELRRDFLLPESRWFARAIAQYQFDEFESWEHRLTVGLGPGYRLIETERHTLDGVIGPAYTREFGERNDDMFEAVVGLNYSWKINERWSLEIGNQLFTEMAPETGSFRNVTAGEGVWRLIERPDLSLVLGFANEWESDPESGDDPNDIRYYLSLGLGF